MSRRASPRRRSTCSSATTRAATSWPSRRSGAAASARPARAREPWIDICSGWRNTASTSASTAGTRRTSPPGAGSAPDRSVRVPVLNAGSSTLKASVLDGDGRDPLFATTLDWGADATRAAGRLNDFETLLEHLVVEGIPVGSIEAVGHRVVHGGTRFTAPVMVDDEVLAALDELADLAPLHNPVAVETIRAALPALPGGQEVAAFDTAFHASLPPPAFSYPLPAPWIEGHGLRRYGFHGLSVAWSVTRAGELLDAPPDTLALVVAHLGSGCSVTAVA